MHKIGSQRRLGRELLRAVSELLLALTALSPARPLPNGDMKVPIAAFNSSAAHSPFVVKILVAIPRIAKELGRFIDGESAKFSEAGDIKPLEFHAAFYRSFVSPTEAIP